MGQAYGTYTEENEIPCIRFSQTPEDNVDRHFESYLLCCFQ